MTNSILTLCTKKGRVPFLWKVPKRSVWTLANILRPLRWERNDSKKQSGDGSASSREKPIGVPGGPTGQQVRLANCHFPSCTSETSEMIVQISIQRSSSGLLLNYISPQFVHSDHQVGLPWAHHWSVPGGSQVRSCAWSPVKFNCVLSELHDEKPSDEMVTESFF